MKKWILLSAIICGYMYGMEPEYNKNLIAGISPYVKPVITSYLDKYDNLDDIINAIKEDSLNKYNPELKKIIYEGNLEGFTALVHMLEDKFNYTPVCIAEKFETPIAKRYASLTNRLNTAAHFRKVDEVKELLQEGADVNGMEILLATLLGRSPNFNEMCDTIELLLDYGANPFFIHIKPESPLYGKTAAYLVEDLRQKGIISGIASEVLKELLKNAMEKYQK